MTENVIYIRNYDLESPYLCDINMQEVWRYAGFAGIKISEDESGDALREILDEAISEALPTLSYKVCYRRMEIQWDEGGMPILPFEANSKDLAKCLKGSSEIIMFAATIGLGIDRLIARNQKIALTKSFLLQALGAERVESLCDVFCNEMEEALKAEGLSVTPRYSPGYGDLPLGVQKDFFNLLDCNRKIGISLNESLLMSPSKSVTAIFGIQNSEGSDFESSKCNNSSISEGSKCDRCNNINCEFRK